LNAKNKSAFFKEQHPARFGLNPAMHISALWQFLAMFSKYKIQTIPIGVSKTQQ